MSFDLGDIKLINYKEDTSASSTASSLMASAFASVSELASKTSILSTFTNNDKDAYSVPDSSAIFVEKNSDKKESSFVLLKGLSIRNLKSNSSAPQLTDTDSKQKSNSLLNDSIAAATSVLNKIKNPLDYDININEKNEANTVKSNQKYKQNKFFQKLEQHSLTFSTSVFGSDIAAEFDFFKTNDVNMHTPNNNRSYSENSSINKEQSPNQNGSIKRKNKPPGTLEYIVEINDTIEKIALKHNTVPSEIQHLNRLVTRVIFPGQTIFVPDPNYVPPLSSSPPKSPVTKAQLPDSILNELNTLEQNNNSVDTKSTNKTTSQGFNIFKWKTPPEPKPGHVELQKQKSLSKTDPTDNRKAKPISRRHTLTEEEAKKLDEECMQRFQKINCKIVTRSKGCFEGVLLITPTAVMFDPFDPDINKMNGSRKNSMTYTSSIYDEASAIIPIEIISNVVLYEDLSLKDVQEYFDYQHHIDLIESDLTNTDSSESADVNFHLVHESDSADEAVTKKVEENTKFDQGKTNCENIQNENKSRANSKSESNDEKNSNSSTSNNGSLISYYLCIKVNKNKDFISCPLNRKMKNRLSSEFWFQINDNSTDKILAFFLEWKSDQTAFTSTEDMSKGQFQLVKQDEKLADLICENVLANASPSQLKLNKSYSSTNRLIHKNISSFVKDWEVVNLKELESKLKLEIEIEKEYKTLPKLIEPSAILKEEHLRKLNVNLIPRAVGYNWVLSFSTELHGFSLNTMYRLLSEVESPCLVVVLDSNGNIFGAMSPCKLYPSEHYYGTGESFLYMLTPSFRVYKWTGENNFFIRGNTESIGFGCAEGYHGLWFDGDLLNGHSQRSKTYDNDMLSSTEYFTITALEVWSFSD